MCKNLVEKGNLSTPLIIQNRTRKRAEDLAASLPEGKSTIVDSAGEAAAKSDIIFVCLLNDDADKAIHEEMIKNGAKGKLFVDCSTVHPDTTEVLAKAVIAQGGEYVACPGE